MVGVSDSSKRSSLALSALDDRSRSDWQVSYNNYNRKKFYNTDHHAAAEKKKTLICSEKDESSQKVPKINLFLSLSFSSALSSHLPSIIHNSWRGAEFTTTMIELQ
jgi:hypothetical protein